MFRVACAVLAVVALLCCAAARSDDWAQFRKDEARTAASMDRISLPMAEIWSMPRLTPECVSTREKRKQVVIWKDHAFYIIPEKGRRLVVCVDLATGTMLWRQVLSPIGDVNVKECVTQMGTPASWLAVSVRGVVFAYDQRTAFPMRNARPRQQEFCVVAMSALDGAPLGAYVPYTGFEPGGDYLPDPILEIWLLHSIPDQAVAVQDYFNPASKWQDMVRRKAIVIDNYLTGYWGLPFAQRGLGPPLLLGEQLVAAGAEDFLFRWSPGGLAQQSRIIHWQAPECCPPHGKHGEKDFTVQAHFSGFPMAMAGGGVLVGEDRTRRFLALLEPGRETTHPVRWHRDWNWSIGLPAVLNSWAYIPSGGPDATLTVMALDVNTGQTRWAYPSYGAAPDGAAVVQAHAIYDGQPLIRVEKKLIPLHEHQEDNNVLLHQNHGAFARNPGLVAMDGRVYGVVRGQVVALEAETGRAVWTASVPRSTPVTTLAGSKDHLFLCQTLAATSSRLVSLGLKDGKEEWSQPVPDAGDIALSRGMLLFSDGETVHGFAPAERLFQMGIDSDDPKVYWNSRLVTPEEEDGAAAAAAAEAAGDAGAEPPRKVEAPPEKALADATVLRLEWGQPAEQMVAHIRARRKAAPGLPLLLSLDWLDEGRAHGLGAGPDTGFAPARADAFVALCKQLAAAGLPEHFDLAPEINVYLARYPDRAAEVRALLQRAAEAVHGVSSSIRTLVSVNMEVLSRRYGVKEYQPFGPLTLPDRTKPDELPSVLEVVEEVGITSYPEAAYAPPGAIVGRFLEMLPGDYFLQIRKVVGKKPVLVTRISVRVAPKVPNAEQEQANYVRRLLQCCYWLDSPLVAYPELQAAADHPETTLLDHGKARPGLAPWRELLAWKRVRKLSAQTRPLGL